MGKNVTLVDAGIADRDIMFLWQEHPLTRRFFRHPGIPSYSEHSIWLSNSLIDPSKKIMMVCADGVRVGVVRLDSITDSSAEVSIYIEPDNYCKGYARRAIDLLVKKYGGLELLAFIDKKNIASRKLFEGSGFLKVSNNHFIRYPDVER